MREPTISKLYPPDMPGRSSHSYVRWYVDRKRQTKKFTDRTRAELFLQEKRAEHLGRPFNVTMAALQELTVMRKAIQEFRDRDDAKVLGLEAENTRLNEEIARLIQKAQAEGPEDPHPGTRKQSVNFRAFLWAYDQPDLSATAKAVLVTFAMHANHNGYTWPGVDRIASAWGMDRDTVRRQIEALLVRRKICRTKKRCGATGRVKVYRMPKHTYESGGKYPLLENGESEAKSGDNRRTNGGESAPNKEQRNKEADAVGKSFSDLQRAQVCALAATATDPLDFCTQAPKLFPGLKLLTEWNDYVEHREKLKRPATIPNFAETWLPRAHPRFGKISPPKRAPALALAIPSEYAARAAMRRAEEQIDPEQHARFLKQMEDRKSRKTAAVEQLTTKASLRSA
jgi:hypothetical protein